VLKATLYISIANFHVHYANRKCPKKIEEDPKAFKAFQAEIDELKKSDIFAEMGRYTPRQLYGINTDSLSTALRLWKGVCKLQKMRDKQPADLQQLQSFGSFMNIKSEAYFGRESSQDVAQPSKFHKNTQPMVGAWRYGAAAGQTFVIKQNRKGKLTMRPGYENGQTDDMPGYLIVQDGRHCKTEFLFDTLKLHCPVLHDSPTL
jgi:hypothetical protein